MNRRQVVVLYAALLFAVLSTGTVFGVLFGLGIAPLLRDTDPTLVALVLALAPLGPYAVALLWAKPQVPLRRPEEPVAQYWQGPAAGGRALLLWVLCEGGAMIGCVGALLTGSLMPAASAVLGVALLVLNGPGHLEGRVGVDR